MKRLSPRTKAGAAASLVLGGGALTALVLTGGTASGETATPGTNGTTSGDHRGGAGEKPLTGTTAAKVKAAALAKYPGATVEETVTDSDGVLEAHLTTKDGQHVLVQVDKDSAVTGTHTMGDRGGRGDRPRRARHLPPARPRRAPDRCRAITRLVVDWTRCDGHGLCAALAPELVQVDEWGYPVVVADADEADHPRRAALACPALALRLEART